MKEIQLTKGFTALVDNEDFERVNKIKWNYNGGYAKHNTLIRVEKGKYKTKTTLMHRFIMNPPPELDIDHINHNTLDNRKENLKICTHWENMMNKVKKNKLGVTGVYLTKNGKYMVLKLINKKHTYLGTYNTIEDAEKHYLNEKRVLVNKQYNAYKRKSI